MGKLLDARGSDGPLGLFLRYYPEEPRAKKIRAWSDEVERIDWERYMVNHRAKLGKNSAEKEVRQALNDEEEGKLAVAASIWNNLASNKDSKEDDSRSWALVAEKRLREIRFAETLYQDLKGKNQKTTATKMERYPDPKTKEEFAMNAIRDEDEGKTTVKERWDALKQFCGEEDDLRVWRLLAQKRIFEIDAQQKKSGGEK